MGMKKFIKLNLVIFIFMNYTTLVLLIIAYLISIFPIFIKRIEYPIKLKKIFVDYPFFITVFNSFKYYSFL